MATFYDYIDPFHATGIFLYPLKTSENLWFSDVIRGAWKDTCDMKWIRLLSINPFRTHVSISSVIRQRGESQNGGNKKTKCFFLKKTFRIHWYAYGIRNIRFLWKFRVLCFLVNSILRLAFLPYYRRFILFFKMHKGLKLIRTQTLLSRLSNFKAK